MNSLAQLLGSSTRANIVEALALANKPMTAYKVSKMYNMNISKVYFEMKRLASFGLLYSTKGNGRGLEYTLADENLRSLASKLSSRVIPFDTWRSPEAKAQRFKNGIIKVPEFSIGKQRSRAPDNKPTRMRGELDTLALLARSNFDKKYRSVGYREYVRL